MKIPRFFLSSFLLFILAGCSSGPQIALAHYFRAFNFDNVKSYAIYGRESDILNVQNINDVTRNQIELVIEHELDQRGLAYQESDNADLMVSYFWVGSHAQDLNTYNVAINYCAACLNMTVDKSKKVKILATHNYLIIDLIDPQAKRSVWRSSYLLAMKEKENSRDAQEKIQQAIAQMFKQYPK